MMFMKTMLLLKENVNYQQNIGLQQMTVMFAVNVEQNLKLGLVYRDTLKAGIVIS